MILYPPPTESGLKEWSWHHYQHHLAINGGLESTRGIKPNLFRIWPLDISDPTWNYEHQRQHNEFTSVLGITASDLTGINYKDQRQFDAFLYSHFVEHQVAAQRLGIPI